jgi:N-acetyl-anhydromuramyl-L-alanine amidase AmpD/uncharacterized protein YegL
MYRSPGVRLQFVLLFLFVVTCVAVSGQPGPDFPGAIWIKDPDYYTGRRCDAKAAGCQSSRYYADYHVEYIIIHSTAGRDAEGAVDEFKKRADKSAHYIVANGKGQDYKDGQVIQMVRDADTAWAVGIWPEKSTGEHRGPIHHFNTINIELAGIPYSTGWCTEKMYQSAAKLVRFLVDKYGIPLDHILGHDQVAHDAVPAFVKEDPCGRSIERCTFDWSYFLSLVQQTEPAERRVTATLLVMDVSGSMGWQWKGGVKIESAKQAALQFIEQVANEPRPPGSAHQIGVVTFTDNAYLALPLTSSYAEAKKAIIQLNPIASTNVGSGLHMALQELEKLPGAQRFIILLSDGMSNTGLSKEQILTGPVIAARSRRICLHTVAFGDPGDIDQPFLQKIALGSGCGRYSYASTGFELFGTYVKLRHLTLGGEQIVEFTSKGKSVMMSANSPISLGAFSLVTAAKELHYTLAWSAPGRILARLVDPSGKVVTATYPGAKIYAGSGFSHVTIFAPKQGTWRVSATPQQSFVQGTQYYGVVSSRPAGVIPFDLPNICIGDWCFPWPDLPTSLLVIISLAALAAFVYLELAGK